MNNILDVVKMLTNNTPPAEVPKEIKDQYPYGEFPLRYTKEGQEIKRKQSENRFQNEAITSHQNQNISSSDSILSLMQILLTKQKSPTKLMEILSNTLFKDSPQLKNLLTFLPNIKSQNKHFNSTNFPNTDRISINSLNRIN